MTPPARPDRATDVADDAPADGSRAPARPSGYVLDARMRLCLRAVALSGAALAVGALAVFGARSALAVALGSGIATGNLWVLGRIVAVLLPGEAAGARAQSRAGWVLVAMLKMVGLVGLLWLLMRHGVGSPLALMAGFGALPIGIAIGSLVSDRSAPREDAR
jgi:hypothetical protein